jgi:hypothetical protein
MPSNPESSAMFAERGKTNVPTTAIELFGDTMEIAGLVSLSFNPIMASEKENWLEFSVGGQRY